MEIPLIVDTPGLSFPFTMTSVIKAVPRAFFSSFFVFIPGHFIFFSFKSIFTGMLLRLTHRVSGLVIVSNFMKSIHNV